MVRDKLAVVLGAIKEDRNELDAILEPLSSRLAKVRMGRYI